MIGLILHDRADGMENVPANCDPISAVAFMRSIAAEFICDVIDNLQRGRVDLPGIPSESIMGCPVDRVSEASDKFWHVWLAF